MKIPVPNQINKFTSLEMDFGTTICPALWLKAAQLAQYVHASYPVGMMMIFEGGQDALPAQPDPKFWQLLDGSTISNANSLLNGVTIPDMRGRFFRHPAVGEPLFMSFGSDTTDLTHNHGGNTLDGNDADALRLDNGDERGQAIGHHTHPMDNGNLGSVSNIPAYHEVQLYIRIA